MRYIRQFTRKQERNQTKTIEQQKHDLDLARKVLTAVTAFSFIGNPLVSLATTITDMDGKPVGGTGPVRDIYAQQMLDKNNTAVNRFNQFNISAGDIANMYFQSTALQGTDTWAKNLVNFVNSRIDVAGTVNAIKDHKIGGNLFFLSKDGMAVTGSGVINAGSLYVMTPTKGFMDDIMTAGVLTDSTFDKTLGPIVDTSRWQEIPVNASGTITILGQVNATNAVKMRAAKIGVGKNVDDEAVYGVSAGAVDAAIKTGVTNFAYVVKLTDEQQKAADITSLTATMAENSGDIVLEAYVDNKSADNPVENVPFVGDSIINDLVSWGENSFKEQTFDASVEVYGEVNAAGKADITAKAVNSNAELNEQGNYTSNGNKDVAQLANVHANVNIGGTVTAAKDVTVKAEALNRYIDNTGAIAKGVGLAVSSGTLLTGDAAYSKLDTDASVTIEKGAIVESTEGDVDIDAKAETLAASAASTMGLKFKTVGGYTGANVPAGAVVYTEVDNDAKVTVNGTVTAKNDVNINADADLKVEAENKMTVTGEKANQFVLGVTIANVENNAEVTIGEEGGSVTATDGNLTVNAKANSDFTSKTSISAGESSAVGIAVNVTEFDSGAKVTIDTDLEAGKDLIVNAADTVEADNVIAESKVGSGKYMSSATQIMQQNGSIDEVKGFFSGIANELGLNLGGDDIKNQISLGKLLKAGATVTYSGQNHNSNVTIDNDAKLTAQNGELVIGAKTLIEDAHFAATGATYSYNDTTSAPATINAAVLVTDMNNSSSVVVEDAVTDKDDTEHKAELSGTKGVDINAVTKFDYKRVEKMQEAVKDAAAQIEHAFTTLGDAFKEDGQAIPEWFNEKIENYKSAYNAFKSEMDGVNVDGQQLASGGGNFINAVVEGYNVLTALQDLNDMLDGNSGSEVVQKATEAFKGASDLFSSALAFVDPNSYGTFAAASASKGSSGDSGGSAPGGGSVTGAVGGNVASVLNGAGAVMVNTVNSVSKVEIGSDTVITSDRNVNIGAENYMKDVSLGGLNTGLFTNSGGGTTASIGATVNYAEFDTDTIIAINDGAEITGGNIGINAQNTIDHVSVAASAGKGPSAQTETSGAVINGMFSFVNGSSDILTVVDNGAKLEAEQKTYTGTNDKGEPVEETTEGNISIKGHNNTNITNVAAGASWGHGSATAGIGVAYTDFDVKNITGVADVAEQIKRLYTYKEHDTDANGEDVVRYIVDEEKVKEFEEELDNKYSEEKSMDTDRGITAYDFTVDAATDGSIQSVSAAGSLSNDDASGQIGFFDKIGSGLNSLDQKLVGEGGLVDKASSSLVGGGKNGADANELINLGTQTHGGSGGINIVGGGSSGNVNTFMPSFSLAGSGSVSINMLDNATEAIVDNAKIKINQAIGKEKGDITVTARDALYAGAYSGAAALQWNAGGSSDDTSVSVSGAAGVNDIDNDVKATIRNSTISGAGKVDTMALSGGEQLALGLGMAIVKADGTKGYSGNAAVSVNLIDHDVEALQENNTVSNTDDVNVYAYARDLENTGGGTFSGGQQKIGGGVTVGVAQLHNNISAGIKGGTYTDVESVDVQALNALQNITVGVAAGVTAPSGDGSSANVQGAGVYNEVHNTTNAFISGSDKEHKAEITTTKDGGIVNVVAQDTAENSDLELRLAGLDDGRETLIKIFGDENGLTGKNYFEGIDTSAAGEEINLDKNSGSSIVTVSTSVSGTNGDASVGVAAAITDIENNYTANIEYADITTEKLTADAGSNSNIVTVAGGVAAANKGSGVGSVSWNDVENTAKVNIDNSVIKAQETRATAENTAQIVSVTGQISGGKKAAVGAALGYVGLDNSTEANITNTTFDKRDTNENDGITVTADAKNSSDSYNIGTGVSAAGDAAVSGTVVVTQTHGTAGAVMDTVTIDNAKKVTANALDDTDILSVIGTVTISGKAAVGAGVAYTEIGDVSTNTDKGQYVTAEIKNNSIINTDEDEENAAVNVTAKDTARVINVAVGVGGSGKVAVQGASATTLINKTTSAEIADTKIDEEGGTSANVTVDAQNDSEITSSASTVAVAGQGAGVGAGIAVNRIIQQTNAAVNGGAMNVNNLTVKADAAPRIENIGIGVAAAAEGAGVTGSVAVNMIQNDVTAHIGSGATIVADGSVGVVATSDEQIANYAGQAAVGGVGAGVGVSVSVNQIVGTTSATVGGEDEAETNVTAKGNDSLTTDTVIDVDINDPDKSDIHNTLIDKGTVALDSSIERGQETRSGLIVDASSTRDLKSFLITAGVAGEGAGVAGTVNVNQIAGGTNAKVTNTTVNGGENGAAVGKNAGVFVNAGDYSNMSGFVGSAGVGGIGAGVGLASDTNTISRNVSAAVDDSDIKANTFELDADSAQGVSSFGVGAGVAGIGGGVAGVVTVTELENTTQTMLNNSKVSADTVNIKANHTGIVNAGNVSVGGAGLGVGGGLSVGVLKDNSTTAVTVKDDNPEEDTITASGDVTIAAANTATVNPMISANGVGAFGGIAGATSINNLNSKVVTTIESVGITSAGGSISGTADNTFNVKAYMGTIGGGAVGVGAGVTVNTIDSTVQTNVNGSTLDAAKDMTLTADETRNITQTATNVAAGGMAVGANIAVTTVGKEIADEETKEKVSEANDVFGEDAGLLTSGAASALATAGIENYTPHVDAELGGGKASQITVNISGSKLSAGDTVKAEATETDDINMTLGSGAAGLAAVNAGVGILDVNRNVGVHITGGSMTADTIDVNTDITGAANLEVYQGSAGVVSGNAAVGQVSTSGSSTITIDNALFTSNTMNVLAADHGMTNVDVLGVTVGAVSVGAIVAGAENTGNTEVEMQNSKIEDKDGDNNGTVSIKTDKANTVTAHAMGGAGGALAAQGVVATASDEGESRITLQVGNALAAKEIAIAAKASPAVKAVADSAAVSVFGTAGGAGAEATANGTVSVTVVGGNELNADTVDISADAATQDGKNTAEAAVVGASGSGYYTLAENLAKADVAMNVTVDVGDVAYKTETTKKLIGYKDVEGSEEGERTEVYAEDTKGVTNLTISSSNAAKASADAKGITIGGIFSSGNNQALTSNTSQTKVILRSGSENTRLGSLTVTAAGAGDNTAKADGSGGGLVSGDLAAYVKNEMNATTQVDISGMLEVEGDVRIEALQSDTANINADALKAAVVGASATKAENSITGTTGVSISGAAITSGGDMDVNAANTVTFGDKENYAVEGSGYGGVNVQGAEFDNTIDKKANIAIANSTITTDGAQNYEAKTTGNLNIGGYIKAAGLGAFTWVDVDNTVTSTDRVSVDEKSSLKTKKAGKDIVLAAVDNMDMAVIGVADTQGGAVGGASSDVTSTMNRNNSIDVDGTLYSMNDVNLYAGKDKNGSEGKLDLEADSESYNKTALAVSNPKLNDTVNQKNTVTIGSDSEVSSVRNINLYADAGKETIRDSSVLYTWYWRDKDENYTSSTVGYAEPNNKHSNNFVQADGKLTAGVQNKQYITIGGTYDPETGTTVGSQLIFFDDQVKDAVNAYENGQEAVGKGDLIITTSAGVDKKGIGTGTMDYGTTLFDRYNELGELMQAYADSPNSAAYVGYKAERQRILDQMKTMGLVEEIEDATNPGTTYPAPVEGATIDYIELSDIVASGGNINIQSDNLSGEGSLTAKGAPEVVVNNNTNLYLKVNDITIGEAGGEIHYNNTALTGDAAKDKATIKGLNKDGISANFAVISPDAAAEDGGRIVINGNYGGTIVKANVTVDGQTQEIQMKPRADIEINGLIDGGNGTVEISSAANNIVIQGDSASESAGVKGQTVKLIASQGSVSQGFQEGIVSIGGDVQKQYDKEYQEGKNNFDDKYGYEYTEKVHETWGKDNVGEKIHGNMIAGENIYINASDINVNGSIQSGYADYVVNIGKDAQSQIDQMQQNWENSGRKPLSDAEVTTGDTYRLVKGKDVLGADGVYYRQVDVFYNPSTGQIVVPDVDAHGGQVYLTGRISSTGSGSIKVLDGAYDITVTNNTSTDLQLGKLVSNDVSGLISIADTGTKRLTEFTRNGTVVKDMTQLDKANGDYKVISNGGASSSYRPEDGLRYNWTTGQQVTTEKEYTQTIKAGLWGLVETLNDEQMTKIEQEIGEPPTTQNNSDKPNGEYIGKVDSIDNNQDFTVIYDNTVLKDYRVGPGEPERWSTGFLGWFKWEKYTWTKVTGTSQQYVASVKADKPIEIGFFGNADGNSNININAAGNINLTNTIGSASSGTGSVIDITSTGGALNQKGGSLVGDNINLQAAAGINDVNITSMGDTVQLNAVNSGSGDVTIDVSAAYGTKGNVVINQLFAGSADAQKGNVSLTAAGNITQSGTGVSVSGNRIDLTSENGAIGTDEQAIVVNGGQSIVDGTDSLSASVNAQAKDDINLTQAQGDMRIGRVYSDNGDVTITVTNGSLIDALPDGETIDRGSTDALIQKWKDLGLIDGDGKYTESQEQDVAEYEAAVRNEFEQYEMLKGYYEDGEQHSNDAGYAAYEKLAETYGGYESADAYLAGDAAQTHIGELRKEGAGWSEDQLLYAISDAIINQESGATDTIVKDPNLKGHNITLNVSGDVGRNSDDTTEIKLDSIASNIDGLKQLANANAGSVTWNEAEGVAIINEKTPLGVQLTGTGGSLNVQAGGNVYLAGRTEGDGEVTNVLNVDSIKGGNIRLQGKDGIYNVHADLNEAAITGNNLLMQGGDGSIGTADKAMTIDVSGPVQMTAGDNIYVNQVGDDALQIYSMGAGQDIVLAAKTDIVSANTPVSSDEEDDEDGGTVLASGYIRSDGGSISLTAGGAIGTEGQGLRILDNGAVVNAAAQGDIYVAGVSGTGSTGTLAIGKINSAGVAASITAETDIAFAADSLVSVQNGTGTLTLTAEQGSVTQGEGEEGSGIYAGTVDVSSKGSQLLENAQNRVTNFVVRGLEEDNSLTGNVHLVSGAETVHINFSADEEKGLTVNDGSITVHHNGSADGELRVTGSATTKNASSDDSIKTDIVMSSLGSLTSDGALDSAGNVCMDAAGNITQKNSVTAVGEAMFTSDAGSISLTGTTTAGRVEATTESEADEGTITFSGDVTANTGDITVDSNGGAITIGSSAVSEKSYIDLSSETGAITVTGSAKAGGDVTAETKDGSITFGQESTKTGSVTSATGNVTAKTDSGNISVYGTADADKDILFESSVSGTIRVDGTSTAGQHFTAETGSGDIALNGSVKAMDGDVTATSKKGSISTSEDVFAGQNVTVETVSGLIDLGGKVTAKAGAITATTTGNTSGTSGSITLKGDADAAQTITLSSDGGAITVTGSAKADGDVTAETKDGSITFGQEGSADSSVTSESGEVKATTGRGDITIYGTSTAGTDFTAKTDAGDITLDGNITAQTGMVMAQAFSGSISAGGTITSASNTELTATGVATDDSGNITVNGEIASGKEVHASATNGSIRFEGTTTASAGDVTATVSGDGDITFNGAVTAVSEGDAGGNIAATVSGTGNITTDRDAVFKADKDIQFTTNAGSITTNSEVDAGGNLAFTVETKGDMIVRDDLTAGQNIDLNVNSGNILFEGTQGGVREDIYVTSDQGDVTVSINESGSGDIKDTNGEGETGDRAHLKAGEGNVTVKHDGIGDVDLYEVYAKQDAGISVADGNLHLVDVSGNLVAIFVKSDGKEMDVENIEAAQQIAISGSNMDLDSITQREDGDGFLVITPEGTAEDRPIDNLVIGDILTNGGVRFDHLWLNTGNIHVSEGALHLDKVYVQDKATFSTDDMTTNVFGSAPVYDDSVSSSYWVNTSINSPKDDLAAWNSDELNDKWMHIFFSPEGTVQISNGNLLHLADHNYAYNQRYSQVNWMNIFTDEDFYNFYDKYYAPDLSYHERYGLTSGSGHSVENAEEDEVIVE